MMTIAANRVGTDETGTSGVPNQLNGIYAFGAGISLIGGATAAEGNTIAFNLGAGIAYPGYISGGERLCQQPDLLKRRGSVSTW